MKQWPLRTARTKMGYDQFVKRAISAIGAFLVLIVSPGVLAQINGVPASVTSIGFGGHFSPGVPPSVTSLGPHGFYPQSPFPVQPVCCGAPVYPMNPGPQHGFNGHHHRELYAVPVPVYVPYDASYAEEPASDQPEDMGGPTIFDRRGNGQYLPAPEVHPDTPAPRQNYSAAASESPGAIPTTAIPSSATETAAELPQTVLVYRDGHQLEVENYAIQGAFLYDLTPGHPRKIQLADLDLAATQKANDDRGLDFQLPQQTSPTE
jgi:hypothetical protein